MKQPKLFILFFTLIFSVSGFSQNVGVSMSSYYMSPSGDFFEDANGSNLTTFGLGFHFDGMYFFTEQFAAGLNFQTTTILTSSEFTGTYQLSHYGLMGYYRFNDSNVSPYTSLSIGVSRFKVPINPQGGTSIIRNERRSSLGLKPEFGIEIDFFYVSAAYLIPMEYSFNLQQRGRAGGLQFNFGARLVFLE